MPQKITKLPPFVTVGGIPLFLNNADAELNAANLISRSEIDTQNISILSTIPMERQHRLLCGEMASQLLYAAGLDMAECDRIYINVGNTLHNMLKDNNFTWVADLKAEIPTAININGITYAIRSDALLKLLPLYKIETRKQFAEKLKALFCPGCDYSAVDIMATIDAVAEELNKDGDNNVPGN